MFSAGPSGQQGNKNEKYAPVNLFITLMERQSVCVYVCA